MAQQSARRGRENQGFPQCLEHALGDLDPARELPYRPAADHRCTTGRTDGSIRLPADLLLKPLALGGASTDELIVPGARIYDLVPVRELPYGPAAPSLHQRPDRWQHPTTCQFFKKPLALGGASTDEYPLDRTGRASTWMLKDPGVLQTFSPPLALRLWHNL